jgi:hypothetical protein
MRNLTAGLVAGLVLAFAASGAALAADPHSGGSTGQPNQSCQSEPSTPGSSASAPGSAFNPSGTAGSHYAGEQPQNSGNPSSVSQYDTACYQVSH